MSQPWIVDTGFLVALLNRSERHPNSPLLTLDSDFQVYRKNKDEIIPTRMPNFP